MKKIFVFLTVMFMLQLSAIDSAKANDDGTYCDGCQGYVEETYTGDECGGVECTAATNPSGIAHPPGSHYGGSPQACAQGQTGITIHHFTQNCPSCPCCSPDCSCASSTYAGSNCSNGCGGSCPGIRRDGVCGTRAKVYEATDIALSGAWCTYGTASFPNGAPALPAPGGTSVDWTCSGVSGGNPVTNCHASRKLPPPVVVDLVVQDDADDNVLVDKIANPSIKKEWNTVGATYCEGNGLFWHQPLTSVAISQSDPPAEFNPTPFVNRTSSGQANYSTVYNLVCYNQNGADTTTRSNTTTDNVSIAVNCTPDLNPPWSDCSKACGDGIQTRTVRYANCYEQTTQQVCNNGDCPVSSEWKEVRP